MDLSGNPLHLYPGDAGLDVKFDSPANGSFAIERIVWRRTQASTPADGDSVALQSDFYSPNPKNLFHRIWADTENDVILDLGGQVFTGLKLTHMDSGVLDIYIL